MLSIFESYKILENFGLLVSQSVKDDLLTKKVKRYTPTKGHFEAVAANTGKTAGSVAYRVDGDRVEVYADQSIDNILKGQAPGYYPPIADIDQWLSSKGIELSPFAVSNAIYNNGSSIYQAWMGQENDILADSINEDIVKRLAGDISKATISGIINQVKAAA